MPNRSHLRLHSLRCVLPHLPPARTIAVVTTRTASSPVVVLLAAAALGLSPALVGSALAQVTATQPLQTPTVTIDGRSFAGIAFQSAPQQRDALLRASEMATWTEGATRRLYLEGDIRLEVGNDTFSANQATVWLQPLDVPGRRLFQLAVYFDRVTSPLAEAGITHEASGLLLTAVIEGEISLKTDVMSEERPSLSFIEAGERRLASYLQQIAERAPTMQPPESDAGETDPELETPVTPSEPPSEFGVRRPVAPDPSFQGPYRDPDDSDAIFAKDGIVTLDAENISLYLGEEQPSAVLTGNVYFHYLDVDPATQKMRQLTITAERAVVFLKPADNRQAQQMLFRAAEIDGIYLEGAVTATGSLSHRFARTATDGSYTLRGPHMYYDMQAQRALIMDAVFSTFDQKLRQPIYLRAQAIRQEAANQWLAKRATLANSAFFEPHFSLGASRLTVQQREEPTGAQGETQTRNLFSAEHITLNAGPVPFFYWPYLEGEIEDIPLREVSFGDSRDRGFGVRTEWDLISLLGLDKPDGLNSRLLLDWSEHRAFGFGLDADYQWSGGKGDVFTYYTYDRGRDRFSHAVERDRYQDNRGMLQVRHRQELRDNWSVAAEFSFISDPAFLEQYFDRKAETDKEFETALYLQNQTDTAQFSILLKPDLIEFTPNEYLLQTQGYQVEKLPEINYTRPLDVLPEAVNYSSEFDFSRMRLSFPDFEPRQIGLIYPGWSDSLFGASPTTNLTDQFHNLGYDDNYVHRFDTRHELALPAELGDVNLTPFVTGRFTAYDDHFAQFSSQDDLYRFWGAVGMRASTTFQGVDDSIDSRLLDLHRLRHLVEPNLTVWSAWTTIDAADLPVYDRDVEALAQGQTIRAGVRQTWQTKRGGPGRWHNADWLTLDTNVVFADNTEQERPPIGRYYDYRPEYSVLNDHATADAIWLVSDTLAFSGNLIWDLHQNKAARWSAGYDMRHTPEITSFTEGRYYDALDRTLIDFGANMQLSYRYRLIPRLSFDVDEDQIREMRMTLSRKSPQWTIYFGLAYDRIRDDTSLSIQLSPTGLGTRAGINTRDYR